MIYGDIKGVRKSYINQLEDLYEIRIDKGLIISEEVMKKICEISLAINKEICIVVERLGVIHSISIGNNAEAKIQIDLKEKKKLSGCRVVHTHINSSPKLSETDLTSLKNLRLDAISAINVSKEKLYDGFSIGFIKDNDGYEEYLFNSLEEYLNFNILDKIHEIEKDFIIEPYKNEITDRAVLIGCDTKDSLEELKELTYACDIEVVDVFFQNRDRADSTYYIGKGKLKEVLNSIYNKDVSMIIFDDDLSGSQIRIIEEMSGIRVIDRTTLILEIFARRAKSKVSKYQVELARLKYKYSRLRGLGVDLAKSTGCIGVRGGYGETKLETDRRYVRHRIDYLKDQLKQIKLERNIQREGRIKNRIPQVSIVGYTNAGKSTLRNYVYSIANDNDQNINDKFVFEADMLFATLDTTVRKVVLPRKTIISLTDTVGFIKKLPHDLVEAFKSTLEEVIYSDLILHVVDISSPNFNTEIDVTNSVLEEIGVDNPNKILVFNKIDKLDDESLNIIKSQILERYKDNKPIFISAKDGRIDNLLTLIEDNLNILYVNVNMVIPYSDYSVLNSIYNNYKIIKEEHLDEGTYVEIDIPKCDLNKFEKYIVNDLER